MNYSIFALILTTLCSFQALCSQRTVVNLEHFSTEDGLSQSEVVRLLQDDKGYLWVGTKEGLNLFDAYRFQVIEGPNNSLDSKNITLLHQDKLNRLWISAEPNYNFIYEPETHSFELIELPERTEDNSGFERFSFALEDSQFLWLSNIREIFQYDYLSKSFKKITELKEVIAGEDGERSAIRTLYKIDQHLLIGTTLGLYTYNTETKEGRKLSHSPLESPSGDQLNIKGLFRLSNDYFYIGTVEGLSRIPFDQLTSALAKSNDIKTEQIEPNRNIWDIVEINNQTWLATDDGLYELQNGTQLKFKFRFSDLPYNVFDNDITALEVDREGNLWLSSREDGFFMWNPTSGIKKFISNERGKQKILPSNSTWELFQESENEFIVGTTHGLARLNIETQETEMFFVNDDEKLVYGRESITQVVKFNNEYWVARLADTKVLDPTNMSQKQELMSPEAQEMFKSRFYGMTKLNDDKLFLMQRGNAFIYDRNSKSFEEVEALKPAKDETPYFNVLNANDYEEGEPLLLSTYNRVDYYNPATESITKLHQVPEEKAGKVYAQSMLKINGQIWLSYYGLGIYIIDESTGNEIKFLPGSDLGSDNLLDLFKDKNNVVWSTSNDGLIKINSKNYSTQLFNRKDGFPSDEFMGGTAQLLEDNTALLATTKGIVQVDLDKLNAKRDFEPKVELTEISLLSKPENKAHEKLTYEVFHDDFGLNVKFSALIFNKRNQIRYQYWIEGDSKTEPTTTNKSELFFPKLNPGKSTLKIIALDYQTGLPTNPLNIKIRVFPAPWFSMWAYIAYALVIGSILFVIYYQKRKRQIALLEAHEAVTQSEERLQLALSGSDSGMWDWQSETDNIYEPRLQGVISENELQVSFDKKLEYVHPDDTTPFKEKWQQFLSSNKESFNHSYRMKSLDGEWRWYRDLARVAQKTSQGKPARITGTFTDITERKDIEDKMQLFFEAFDNTREIIIILNEYYQITAVNHAFYQITGLEKATIINKTMDCLIKPESKVSILQSLKDKLSSVDQCESEGYILRKYRDPLPVIINGTCFKNKDGEKRYVITVTDISEQKAAQEELKKLANYDPLTGLPNRALLMDRITHAIEHSHRRKQKISVMFIDLDRFKKINDTLGHEVGDLLLIEVARILKSSIREDDTAARLGGDEFVVMLEDIKSINTPSRIANVILNKMRKGFTIAKNEINTSPSIGISIYPDDGKSPDEMLKHADMAMYHAKGSGRNNFQFFESTMNEEAQNKLSMENQVRRALKNEEFFLVYQPQVDVKSGMIIGFEALARWETPIGDLIPPNQFIPVLEDLGLIIPATELFIRMALKEVKRWQSKGYDSSIAINLSAHHLKHHEIVNFMEKETRSLGIDPKKIEFELTENLLMEDIENSLPIIRDLAKLGIELTLDDFGTGYSSLKYLHELPIHKLKVDQNFVWQIGKQPESEAIIETIISLSKSLKLKTVVEGVETEGQLKFVQKLNANYVQGYYFSKPLPADEALEAQRKTFDV